MEVESNAYGFKKHFEYKGMPYSIHVVPFIIASDQDRKMYNLEEGQFLIHLFDGNSFQSFCVFYNDQLEWDANVSTLVLDDKDLIEKIGFLIDDYYA
jgi:hypothetical protein